MHTTTADAAPAERQQSSPKGRALRAIALTVSFLLGYLTVGIVVILVAPVYLVARYIETGGPMIHGSDRWHSS
jgi:hypothetical protein